MRTRLTYKALRGALLVVALGLTACVNTLEVAIPNGFNAENCRKQAIGNAVDYFDNHRALLTRSAEAEPTEEAPFVVGNIVPDWDSAVTIANDEKRHTDFAMRKDYRFFLLLGEGGEQQAVELYSRFASVEEFALDTMNQFVATYIPAEEYLPSYPAVAQDYGINCAELYEFSGVVLYTMLSGHYVAAGRYQDGELTQRAFLYDEDKTTEENIADFYAIMEGTVLGVAVVQQDTRVVLENENNPVEIEEIVITQKPPFKFAPIEIMSDNNTVIYPIVDNEFPFIVVGGGGGESTTTEEEEEEEEKDEEPTADELVEALFDTEGLSDEQKDKVGKMLQEIIKDCMGEELYNQLLAKLNDNHIQIVFSNKTPSYLNNILNFNENSYSDTLLHELFHAYQDLSIQGSLNSISVNLEIEAQLAKYKYAYRKNSPVPDDRRDTDYRHSPLKEQLFNLHILTKEGVTIDEGDNPITKESNLYLFDYTYQLAAEEIIRVSEQHGLGYKYDKSRGMDDNLKLIIDLSLECE